MNKTINATILLLTFVLISTTASAFDSYSAFTITPEIPHNAYSVQAAAFQFGSKDIESKLTDVIVRDATIKQIIVSGVAGIAATTVITVLVAQFINYIKNEQIRTEKRKIEIARLKEQLAKTHKA